MIRKATVEGGAVRGIPAADPRVTVFKGVPYAAPPVGELRWRAPQPVRPWEGEKLCAEFAPIAMQTTPGLDPNDIYTREWHVDPAIPMSEDCLYLNIWTPAKSAEEKLPVFVWYFGGGLQVGYPPEMEFDGERIARRGIVVVTVCYRLNLFGFLAHPQLTAEQPDDPTNFGNLDQQYATRWCKRNIAAFGGDPDNITIGGQSAGGGSVCAQLNCPANEGLFRRAIIESGFTATAFSGGPFGTTFEKGMERGVNFFNFLGIKTLEEARALDAFYLRDKVEEFHAFFATTPDGVFQSAHATGNILRGRRLRVPLLITRTSDEFKSPVPAKNMEEFRAVVRESFGEYAEEFLKYCGDDFEEAAKRGTTSGLEVAARTLVRRNADVGITEPVYYGVFDPEIPGWDNPGTFHSSDLWFYFESLAKCWRPFTGKHYDLARNMCNYWANFIRSGDPNGAEFSTYFGAGDIGEKMPEWKPLTVDEPNAMWFGDKPEPRVDVPDEATRLHTAATVEKYRKD